MSKLVDLSGQQIGNWKVVMRCEPPEGKKGTWWLCECQCEAKTTRPVAGNNLTTFKKNPPKGSGSCGCVGAKKTGDRRRTHGQSGRNRTPEYSVWRGIIKRCTDPNDAAYPNYGGRKENPRTVCARWKDFANFFADMGERPENAEIDRIDNSGSYVCGRPECSECGPLNREPNCRWVTRDENQRNREEVHKFEYQGEMLTCGQISERIGGSPTEYALYDRLVRQKLSVEEAISRPVPERVYLHEYQGEMWTVPELAELSGISKKQLKVRLRKYGWSVEKAISTPVNNAQGKKLTFEWQGQQRTLKELSDLSGVSVKNLYQRITQFQWSVAQAMGMDQ